jgi:RNA polymerase sigma-70 factor (ECF subfamily)
MLERREKAQTLWSMVEQLPEHHREVIRLAHDTEIDIEEMATMLDVPPGTVKSRLHYARSKLMDRWQELNRKGDHP